MESVEADLPTVQYTGGNERRLMGNTHSDTAYENNTYIDWLRESCVPSSEHTYKKWMVLVLLSLAVGYAAILIDLSSVWLNDFKKGICISGLGQWSLLSPYLTCPVDQWFDWLLLITGTDNHKSVPFIGFPIYVICVALFLLCAGYITITRAPLIKQSGIPEMKLIIAGFNYNMDSYLGSLMLLYKIAGVVLVASSGLWLGKEGPLVHVSCCLLTICFEYIYGKKVTEGLRRELLSAAVATGIAVAFNSPVGGVLCVVELLPSFFNPKKNMWNSFVSATIALVALYGIKLFTDGKKFQDEVLFKVLFGNFSWLFMETLPFVVLGLAGGLYGSTYSKTYLKFANPHFKKRIHTFLNRYFRVPPQYSAYGELLLIALVTGCLTYFILLTKLPLHDFLKVLFTDCLTETSSSSSNSADFMCGPKPFHLALKLIFIFVQGFVLSAYAYGLSLPGGVLMPSFVLGGTLGRCLGIICQALQNRFKSTLFATCTAQSCIVSPSSYAVVGSAAFVTGITKLTLSVVVIVFELTGAVSYVLPIMIAVMTSKFFNDWLCEENIYDTWLNHEFNVLAKNSLAELNLNKGTGLCNFSDASSRFRAKLPDVPIEDVMVPILQVRLFYLYPERPYLLSEIYGYLSDDSHEGYPLLASKDKPVNVGYLPKRTIYKLIMERIGNVQPGSAEMYFLCEVPESLQPQQAEFDRKVAGSGSVHIVPVETERTTLVVKSCTSLRQVICLFEKLYLNTLIIHDQERMACGFIDRFMLSRLMHLGFQSIQQRAVLPEISDFEIISDEEFPLTG